MIVNRKAKSFFCWVETKNRKATEILTTISHKPAEDKAERKELEQQFEKTEKN